MKKIYLLLSASMIAAGVSAKTTSIGVPNIYPHFTPQMGVPQEPGADQIRIIAKAYSAFNGSVFEQVDSTTYAYAGGRGGLLTPDDLTDKDVNFDESISYVFNPSTASYNRRLRRLQSFDNSNKAQLYFCQSWRQTFWKDSARWQYNYNADGDRVESTMFQLWYDGNIWADHVPFDNVYDANNNIIESNSLMESYNFAYDADNRLIQRTDIHKTSTGSPWVNVQRVNFVYSATGKLDHYIIQKWDGSWLNSMKLDLSYTGTDVTSITESKWENGGWTNSGINQLTYDANHNKLSDVRQDWDDATNTYAIVYRSQWTYNNSNQPVIYTTNTWDNNTSSWINTTDDFQYHYYYETYFPTGIHQLAAAAVDLKLYPIPAQNNLNIDMKWQKAQPYTLSIYDMQGKIVMNSNESATSFVQKTIPVNDLPSGNYFIKVSGIEGQRTEKFAVMH